MAPLAPRLRPPPPSLIWQCLPSLAALGLLLLLRQAGLSERLNLFAYDLATHLRPAPSGATTPVRIIGIDGQDLARHGPIVPDALLADAVERLDRIGVRAIGLDLFCGQAVGAGWQRLRRHATSNPRLVSIYFDLDGQQAIPGTPPHRQAYADLYTDPQDGVLRRDVLHVSARQEVRDVSLPMRMVQIATARHQPPGRLQQHLATAASLEVGAGGYLPQAGVAAPGYLQRMLPFHQPGSFPTWSLRSLLRDPLPREQAHQLRNSIVLIGVVAPSSKDNFPVPFSAWRQGERRYELPGVEIHAHRLAGLLALVEGRSHGIQAASADVNVLLLCIGLVAGVVIGEGVGSLRRSVTLGGGVLLLGVAATAGALAMGVWWDGALPLMALALMAAAAWTRRGMSHQLKGIQLEHQSSQVRSLLARFVSKDIAQELLDDSSREVATKQLRNVTVLMSDLRGFSVLAKDHHPSVMVRLLNNYLEVMFDVVEEHGGTIDEVQGDAILVLFGAPVALADHGEVAIACALSMQLAMERVNRVNHLQGLPQLEMGIGLCSGDVYAGTIGSQRRAKYGVVGAAVNLAARIEALTVGGEVLVAESTVRATEVPLRLDGEVRLVVKGSSQPLLVYAVGAIAGPYNLVLPNGTSTRQALKEPLAIAYVLLQGKQLQGSSYRAALTHLAEREAWMVPEGSLPEPFSNLMLTIPGVDGDVYAMVRNHERGTVNLVFTVMPLALKALIRSLGAS